MTMDDMIEFKLGGATVRAFPEQPVEPMAAHRRISVGAFFDRFGRAKWSILADESPQVRAVVRDASVRKWIDLDNPDLPAGLVILQAAGHDIDAQAIVGQPVAAEERP
ncbi:hypothetical protein [Paracidovorax cattleyae]|uniref:hypothetical protein n=1 Tax=Paracidovorax cattleyae TaxID=80868 RepID=UPI001A15DD8B|nr:hypothetical protein [Paracidovorax cattleyae]MBF9263402.1 hypothetical protein [Paracidovorax cattleyae]